MQRRRRSLTVLIAALLPSVAERAVAQNTTWIGGTDWSTAANWSNGVPNSSGAVANFTGGGTSNVNLSTFVGTSTLNFSASNVAYDLTANNGALIQNIASINMANNVAVTDQIDFVGPKDSLDIADDATLLLNNNSTAGGMLLIGPRTVIGDYSVLAPGHNISVNGPGTTQITGWIDSTVNKGLTKNGPGTFVFGGITVGNGGPLTLNGGQMILDYSAYTSNNDYGGQLVLENGVLTISHSTSLLIAQSFGAQTIVSTAHTSIQSTGTGIFTLAAGNIAHFTGGTLDFVLSGGDPNFVAKTTTANNATGGLLGSGPAYATVNGGTTWAVNSGGAVTALLTYGTNTYTSGTNTDVTSSSSQSSITTNSLRFSGTNLNLTFAGSNTIQSGGILVTPSAGNDSISGASATLTATSGGEIVIHQYSTGSLTIAAALSSTAGLTKTGSGLLTLSGNNIGLTGPININRGGLTITGVSAVNSASAINFNDDRIGTSLQTLTISLPNGVSGTLSPPMMVSAFSASGAGTVISSGTATGSTITLAGVISSVFSQYDPTPAPICFTGEPGNSSGFVLGNANTFLGNVYLTQGSLQIGSNGSLGNTGNSLTLDTNDAINGGLVYAQAGVSGGFTLSRSVIIASTSRITTKGLATETISGSVSGAGALVKAAVGTLNLTGIDSFGGLQVTNGAVSFTSGGSLTTGGNILVGNGASGQSGVLNIDGGSSVVQTGSGSVQVGSSSSGTNGTINVGTSAAGAIFTVGSGGMVINTAGSSVKVGAAGIAATMNSSGNVLVNSGTLVVNAGSRLNVSGSALVIQSGATFTNNGTVNLTNGDMIVNYSGNNSPVNSIRSSLTSAFDGSAWDGTGITSSTAANNTNYTTALGYAEASDLAIDNGGVFDGQTIANEAVIIKYTYNGDSNLDGVVTTDDFFAFVAGFNGQGSGWAYGDYNYDGQITTDDLFIFVAGFNLNGQPLSELKDLILENDSLSVSEKSEMLASVPEPGLVCVVGVLPVMLGARRRRRMGAKVMSQRQMVHG